MHVMETSLSTLFDQSCCHYLSFCLRLWLAVLSTVRGSVHSGDGFSFIYCNAAALIKASWAVSHTDSVCQKPFQCLINWTLQRPRLHKVCRQWNLNLRIKQRLLLPNISININVQSEMYSPKQIHIISAYGKCYKVKLRLVWLCHHHSAESNQSDQCLFWTDSKANSKHDLSLLCLVISGKVEKMKVME